MPDQRPLSWHQQPPDVANLSPDSFTAQKLQHATPEHLFHTSRRFFIGPIPTAWLSKHRRDWYKHHLRINYSTRTASFSSDPREARQRRLSGLEGPSSSALFQHSFPQPDKLDPDEERAANGSQTATNDATPPTSATATTTPALQILQSSEQKDTVLIGSQDDDFVDAPSEQEDDEDLQVYTHQEGEVDPDHVQKTRASSTKSFVTASSVAPATVPDDSPSPSTTKHGEAHGPSQASGSQDSQDQHASGQKTLGKRPMPTMEAPIAPTSSIGQASVDAESTSSLLPKTDLIKPSAGVDKDPSPHTKGILARVKRISENALATSDSSTNELTRRKSNLRNLVKFDIPEDSKRAKMHLKAKQAQMTITRAPTKLRRQKLRDGLVVKMERMLVRVDAAGEVPDDFDENVNQRVTSRVKDKWREYMIVCRHSHKDDADFVLQLYKTRVIPEIEQHGAGKKAAYEVPLGRKTSKVNLYSSLDKSIVVSTPTARGNLIFIMQARTASNAVEWFTFLRNLLGWRRASELQINIPDMSLSVRIANPFEKLETSQNEVQQANDTEEAILKTMKEEQAVASDLIKQCLSELAGASEWASIKSGHPAFRRSP